MTTESMYEVLNPRGIEFRNEGLPLNERVSDLTNKKIYLIDVGKPQSDDVFDTIELYIAERIPQAIVIRTRKKLDYFHNEPELWDEVQNNADAFILGSFD